MVSPETATVTIAEFARLPDDDVTLELIDGRVVTMPEPGMRHARLQSRVSTLLENHLRSTEQGGAVLGESGFRTDPGAQTVRAPDVGFIGAARAAELGDEAGVPAGAPDLSVEILSPSDTHGETQAKAMMWLVAGSALVLVVDPEERSVTAYRGKDDIRIHVVGDSIDCTDVVPSWRPALDELFA